MANKRTGLGVESLFQAPEPDLAAEDKPKKEVPQPKTQTAQKAVSLNNPHERETSQTNILLYDDQIDWLDLMTLEARKRGGKRFRKAVIARAIFDVVKESGVNLKGVSSEDEIKQRFIEAFKSQ